MPEISEEAKNLIAQFQAYQQQLQTLLIQKESLGLQSLEIDKALEELEGTKQTTAYKISGPIMINKPVSQLKKELNEIKENINIRTSSLEKSINRININLGELQNKLKVAMK